MRYLLLLSLFAFVGCASSNPKKLAPVSIAPITAIGDNVSKAQTSTKKVIESAKVNDVAAVIVNAREIEAVLEVTAVQIKNYKQELLDKNVAIDKFNDKVENLTIDRDKYKSAMWKRNWIILGMSAALGGLLFWIFKGPLVSLFGTVFKLIRTAMGIPV